MYWFILSLIRMIILAGPGHAPGPAGGHAPGPTGGPPSALVESHLLALVADHQALEALVGVGVGTVVVGEHQTHP